MSIHDSILLSLNLKEENIKFDEEFIQEEKIRGRNALVYHGTLTYETPGSCPVCGCINDGRQIIKNGTKSSMIVLPSVSLMDTYLHLRKQRWYCRDCHHTFTASTRLVEKNCFISDNTKRSILLKAKKKISQKDIAEETNVSHGTVNALLFRVYKDFVIKKNFLPKHLCFDEFRSVKNSKGHMSFMFLDADNHRVVDILEDRTKNELIRYFLSFSRKARLSVRSVCMDMYAPYMAVVKACFPNARIIIDRFHIVQLISRSLNQTRIDLMKSDSKNYKKLKRYWKLILQDYDDLNDAVFRNYLCFKKPMRELDIVDHLIRLSPSFSATYWLYQELLHSLKSSDPVSFFSALEHPDPSISDHMKKSVRSLLNNRSGIVNSMTLPFSNGPIEGTNNLVKTIKRIAFGYRSFISFKVRIFLIADVLIPIHKKRESVFAFAPS